MVPRTIDGALVAPPRAFSPRIVMMGTAAMGAAAWVVPPHAREKYVEICRKSATNGYVSGQRAKMLLGQSGLPTASLRAIWDLADLDKDGALNQAEFVVSGLPPRVPTRTLLLEE